VGGAERSAATVAAVNVGFLMALSVESTYLPIADSSSSVIRD
jgi:hypothetical protein